MLQDARDRSAHGFGLPRHVEASFRRLLACGIVDRGFERVACPRLAPVVQWPTDGGGCGGPRRSHPPDRCRLPAMDVVVPTIVAVPATPRPGAGLGRAARVRARRVRVSSPPRVGSWHHGWPDRHRDPNGRVASRTPTCISIRSFPRACGTSNPMARWSITHCHRRGRREDRLRFIVDRGHVGPTACADFHCLSAWRHTGQRCNPLIACTRSCRGSVMMRRS